MASVATTEKVTAVFCIAVVGVTLPTVGAVVSAVDELDELAETVTETTEPLVLFAAASTQVALAFDVVALEKV